MAKLVAPVMNELLDYCHLSPFGRAKKASPALLKSVNSLFEILAPLAPDKDNPDVKSIWLMVPRGDISDFGNFEEEKDDGYVKTYEEFEKQWMRAFPDELVWYHLGIRESSYEPDIHFRAVFLNEDTIADVDLAQNPREDMSMDNDGFFGGGIRVSEEDQIELLGLLCEAAEKSMALLQAGTYNNIVSSELPYEHRFGVIRRSEVWNVIPSLKERVWDGMEEEIFRDFKTLLPTNRIEYLDCIKFFTANDFFNACAIGYHACGYNMDDLSPVDAYLHYGDSRDEGLTGRGMDSRDAEGVNPEDPKAWDEWFNSARFGGHPWEVLRGGSYTSMNMRVEDEKRGLKYALDDGKITEEEYEKRKEKAGYYFIIAGPHRAWESIRFFVALRKEGYPCVLSGAEDLAESYEGSDYIGIVPWRYGLSDREERFPEEYGEILDYYRLEEGYRPLIPYIKWFPEEPARLNEK